MSNRPPTLLAVFAHPDDESFRPGGTLALLARRGVAVHLLTATHGEAGACGDPPRCRPEEMPAVRERELRGAGYRATAHPGLSGWPSERGRPRSGCLAHSRRRARDPAAGDAHLWAGRPVGPPRPRVDRGRCAAEAFRHAVEIAAPYTAALPRSLAERLRMPHIHCNCAIRQGGIE